ncbi:HTH domain-containing protein [uncultured Corynebacterium sp.]|uniref:HTH domain-containing protein n=1 Tax=uncultured Corynebacterium sp. TaxID=159447 RepID=UPI00288BA5F1|nr:HTH domain-containing protein [uncultured Corynebacterium sp.]
MLRRSSARGVSAERLAREFEVSVRTVKRDLDALENSGAPIWSRPVPDAGRGAHGGGLRRVRCTLCRSGKGRGLEDHGRP